MTTSTNHHLDFKLTIESINLLENMKKPSKPEESSFKVVNNTIRLSNSYNPEIDFKFEKDLITSIPVLDFCVITNLCCVILDFKRVEFLPKQIHGIFLYNRNIDIHISEYLNVPLVIGGGKILAEVSDCFEIPKTLTGVFSN